MAKPGTQIDVRFYRLRNKLQEKAGGLGGAGGAEGGSFSPELMEKAEAHLQQMSEEYPDWVSTYVVQLMDEHAAGWAKPMAERAVNINIDAFAQSMKLTISGDRGGEVAVDLPRPLFQRILSLIAEEAIKGEWTLIPTVLAPARPEPGSVPAAKH